MQRLYAYAGVAIFLHFLAFLASWLSFGSPFWRRELQKDDESSTSYWVGLWTVANTVTEAKVERAFEFPFYLETPTTTHWFEGTRAMAGLGCFLVLVSLLTSCTICCVRNKQSVSYCIAVILAFAIVLLIVAVALFAGYCRQPIGSARLAAWLQEAAELHDLDWDPQIGWSFYLMVGGCLFSFVALVMFCVTATSAAKSANMSAWQ